jgi:hypothetical protein
MSKNKHNADNHSRQQNPNNDAFWKSRGLPGRPDDWDERASVTESGATAESPVAPDAKKGSGDHE